MLQTIDSYALAGRAMRAYPAGNAMDPLSGLGKALALLRERTGRTQGHVGRALRVTGSSISRLEVRDANPRASTLGAYLEAIGADAHELARALDEVQGRAATNGAQEPESAQTAPSLLHPAVLGLIASEVSRQLAERPAAPPKRIAAPARHTPRRTRIR